MTLVGYDLHTRKHHVVALDTETGEALEREPSWATPPAVGTSPRASNGYSTIGRGKRKKAQ